MRISDLLRRLDQRPGVKLTRVLTIQLVFFYALMLVACATSSENREYNKPYGVVRASVQKSIPRGIKTTSRNGRTYESEYFVPRGNWEDDGSQAHERAFARVTILNSSRPFQVEVKVYRQTKISKTEYSDAELDDELSERLSNKIATEIANRREDRNMIDDFKAF